MRAVEADFKEAPKVNSTLSGFAIIGLVIILLAALIGAFAWGFVQFPYVAPPDPTPMPTQTPAIVVNASSPTSTPLPAGVEKRYYVGQWGPQEVLVFNITGNTPVKYDPTIGYRDDVAMLLYGYSGNHHIIPAILNDGSQINMGYYDMDAGVFCYAYPTGESNKTVVVPIEADSIVRARMNDTYGVGNIIIGPDGLIYAEDSEGNIIRLQDGKAISFEEISAEATIAQQLTTDWESYIGKGTGPDTSSGYSTPTPVPTPTPTPEPTLIPKPTHTIINGSLSYTP
jgi:hypothetical protein